MALILSRIPKPALLGMALSVAMPLTASADSGYGLDNSLASDLLQSRAQLRIYRHDDEADLSCQSRTFTDAKVVRTPRVVDEANNERKWVERWILDRCGSEVFYHVYFTEVGDGGAFFSFRELDWQRSSASGVTAE